MYKEALHVSMFSFTASVTVSRAHGYKQIGQPSQDLEGGGGQTELFVV